MLMKIFSVSMVMHILQGNRKCAHGLMKKVGECIVDLLPDLIVFTSPQERSAAPIPRTFDMTLHATKQRTLVQGSEYF